MSLFILDETGLQMLTREIEALAPRPHHSGILAIANRVRPGCTFSYALGRGGWYRQGGVIGADGTRIDDCLENWANIQLDECAGDIEMLLDHSDNSGLLVTRHNGRTHYFVAAFGPEPADFLQLEVEEMQEVLDRQLFNPYRLPEDFQELKEPIKPVLLPAQIVGSPRYRFRRLIDVRQHIARIVLNERQQSGLTRLLHEWSLSSAALQGHFSDHWIITLREHKDRYNNSIISTSLVSRHARALKSFHWNMALEGVELSAQLQAFDRVAGYASAWYFHLLAGSITPPKIAYAIARDLQAGFSYLPGSEIPLLEGWVDAPYTV